MANNICDCCNKSDWPTSIHSSSLGAWSFAYCTICDLMGAEPKFMIDATIDIIGLKNTCCLLTYYDSLTDSYKDVKEGDLTIDFKDGVKIKTRKEAILKLIKK